MSSYPIIINSSHAVNNNTYTYTLPSNVDFSNIDVALGDLSLYYSWFSITALQNNNKFSLIHPSGATNTTLNLTIPDGTYDVSDLNNYLKYYLISQNLYITNNTTGDITVYFAFVENGPAYAISLVCYLLPTATPSGYTNAGITWPTVARTGQFTINNTGFGAIVGFANANYPTAQGSATTTSNSTTIPQISPVQSIIVSLDVCQNPYASNSGVIHTFNSKGTAFGSLISSSPQYPSFVKCQQGHRNSITLKFTDQNYVPLGILDNNITVKLLLQERN